MTGWDTVEVLEEECDDDTLDPLVLVDESVLGGRPVDFLTFPDKRLTPVDPATTGVVTVFLLILFEQLDVVVVAMVVVALVMVFLCDTVLGDDFCWGDRMDAELYKLWYADAVENEKTKTLIYISMSIKYRLSMQISNLYYI